LSSLQIGKTMYFEIKFVLTAYQAAFTA